MANKYQEALDSIKKVDISKQGYSQLIEDDYCKKDVNMSKYEKAFDYLIKKYLIEKGKNHSPKDIYDFKKELIERIAKLDGEDK